MGKTEIELKIQKLSDSELIKMLENKSNYTEDAIQIAETVLINRGNRKIIDNPKEKQLTEEKVESKEISNKYPALKTISGFYNFIAVFSIIGALIAFIYGFNIWTDSIHTKTQGVIMMISSIIYGLIAYLVSKAFAEGILLFIDIANDLSELKTNLLKND